MVAQYPEAMSNGIAKARISQKAVQRVEAGHPWIFSSDVLETGGATPGSTVLVTGPRGQILGTAHYSSTSQIALRLLSPQAVAFDRGFILRRLTAARQFRELVVQDSDAFRLVHAEGDFLPGLIVDNYAGHLVAQFLDQGMDAATPLIVEALTQLCEPLAIVARNEGSVRKLESLPLEKKVLAGELSGPVRIRMNGLSMEADLMGGQKTGVYLDQRENYSAVARYVRPQMRVLDCFTSTGGFALHMARGGAQVEAVDSSAAALGTAKRNAAANGLTDQIRWREADAPRLLKAFATSRQKYDIVVLDPPAFAKSRAAVAEALRAYRDLNFRALQLVEPGGILVTCSCSHHVTENMLVEAVKEAAREAGTGLRVLEQRFQSRDHPILITVPETLYLKVLLLQILPRSTDSFVGEKTYGTNLSEGAGPGAGGDGLALRRAESPIAPNP